jgi:hypothetical protein
MMSTASDDTFEGTVSLGPYRLYPQLRGYVAPLEGTTITD